MAGVYVVSLVLSSAMSSLYIRSMKKQFRSLAYQNINRHLSQLGLFWSDSQSDILTLKEGSMERDQKESINSFLRVALIACFTSIIGCLFLALFIFSIRL